MPDRDPHDVPEGAIEALQHYFDTQHEFLSWLGVEVEELGGGRAVMSIPYQSKLTNVPWQGAEEDTRHPIQGGIASTLVDVVGGIALRPYLDDPLEDGMATINLNVNYLRPAAGDLRAEAEVVRAGRSVGVSEVLVTGGVPDDREREEAVAHGTGAYRLFRGGDEEE
ncbi:PaaI family thioesterase [Salinirubellus sp. GCM10025818]|uniref:PaaI family thioesterase n=1 Tax=Salinirubellus TaxID=2162630 RepID=UPI0030CC2286